MSQDMNILDNTEAKHKPTYQVMREILKELIHSPDNKSEFVLCTRIKVIPTQKGE